VAVRGKSFETHTLWLLSNAACLERCTCSGTLMGTLQTLVGWTPFRFNMSKLKKTLKAAAIAGLCAVGLCAVARKLKLPTRVADLAQSVEAVPFPGTRLYSFLASRQLRPLYAAIADDITAAGKFARMLDLATGPGYLPIELALRNPESSIVGIDKSPEMIHIANADARASHVAESVEFATGDPANLPFPGRYFDLIAGVTTLHHWPEPLAVFEEVFHALVPGGQFWIYDYRKDIPQQVWESLQMKLPYFLRLVLSFGPIASSRAAYSESDLLKMAEQAHFENPVLDKLTLPLLGYPMPVFIRLKAHKPGPNQD